MIKPENLLMILFFFKIYAAIDFSHYIFKISYNTFNNNLRNTINYYFSKIRFNYNDRFSDKEIEIKNYKIYSVIDTTECFIERPEKEIQETYYSGKLFIY